MKGECSHGALWDFITLSGNAPGKGCLHVPIKHDLGLLTGGKGYLR
jgi:hypothetical protein